ncbi:MAG TPA: peroxidase family protein [Allosphingosinicella sp.]
MATAWQETYRGGSAEAERLEFDRLAVDIMRAQLKSKRAAGAGAVDRAFHAKAVLAVEAAELRFNDDLPADLQVGFAKPGAAYPAVVRISNAANAGQPDYKPDLRGIATRITVSPEEQHDLLATNYPVSHARDARQFVRFAVATAGGTLSKIFGLVKLLFLIGPFELIRMLRNVSAARKKKVRSVALETYWSRGAMCWGKDEAVRFLFRPAPGAAPAPDPSKTDPEYLAKEAALRLADGDIVFELCLQRFVDRKRTPIEDTAIEWKADNAPPIPVATLTIRKGDVGCASARANSRAIDGFAFNPWNTTNDFRPLGNLNRARKAAYDASAAHRLAMRWHRDPPLRNKILGALARAFYAVLNRFVEWHKLPLTFSLLNLAMFRHVLRRDNLIDTNPPEAPPLARPVAPPPPKEEDRVARTFEGTANDLSVPQMGACGQPFGRNLKADYKPDRFDKPNPVVISELLLKRKAFIPARTLNNLAGAWIQFQVHDWVDHARHQLGVKDVRVPLPDNFPDWRSTVDGAAEREMRIAGNVSAADDAADGTQRLFANQASHWWDGSEIYGSDKAKAQKLRRGSRIGLDDGFLPEDVNGMEATGFNQSWWLGISALQTLFAREHNVLCDELERHYPLWSEDQVYHTARLIVSALIAKIHTVEWTPAILGTKAIDVALKNNWYGPPSNAWITKLGLWLLDTESSVGIPKTKPDHGKAPYCLTEDFATVYRLHPLIPDDYVFYDHRSGERLCDKTFLEIQGHATDAVMRRLRLKNTLYSFGISHPGAIVLHNYPHALREFVRTGEGVGQDRERIDLAVVDLVRTRMRGVPRYNGFREGLHKPRLKHWEQLSDDPESVRLMKEIYKDIDEVDTVVGLFAEPVPTGFGFSDTAFRIFILMASRRLQSDRFLTVDFRPEIYSPFGMDWIEQNNMTSVILRHCPELAAMLPRDATAFAPWRPVAVSHL